MLCDKCVGTMSQNAGSTGQGAGQSMATLSDRVASKTEAMPGGSRATQILTRIKRLVMGDPNKVRKERVRTNFGWMDKDVLDRWMGESGTNSGRRGEQG